MLTVILASCDTRDSRVHIVPIDLLKHLFPQPQQLPPRWAKVAMIDQNHGTIIVFRDQNRAKVRKDSHSSAAVCAKPLCETVQKCSVDGGASSPFAHFTRSDYASSMALLDCISFKSESPLGSLASRTVFESQSVHGVGALR